MYAALERVFNIPKAFGIQKIQHPIGKKNPENKEWLYITNFVFSFYFLIFYLQFLLSIQNTAGPHKSTLKSLLNCRQSMQARKKLLPRDFPESHCESAPSINCPLPAAP